MPIIMWLFIVPFIASFAILALPSKVKPFIKLFAFLLSLIPLIILMINHFQLKDMSINYPWIPSFSIGFFLKIDFLSLIFLYLTALIIPMSILAVNRKELAHTPLFFSLILMIQGLLLGFFMARDLVVFTIFWEAMLLPLYFIINIWGSGNRQQAALKFLVYMIAGSVLMLAAILFLYFTAEGSNGSGTFNLDTLQHIAATAPNAQWVFLIFLLAFAVKTPLFPFHAWLPDAYCHAPTSGTILLSAILSKAGIYGFFRISLELYPQLLKEWSPALLTLAIIGVFYGGLAAWMQNDFKRLIAYSSFSHVNFILAGLFVWQEPAQAGAILQSINHAITITALFLVAGWLESRVQTTSMNQISGLAKYMPKLCWLTLFFVTVSIALPGTNNFVGELMILFGLFGQNPWVAATLGLSIIFSVIYMLRFMQCTYFGVPSSFQSKWIDIGAKELLISTPLVFMILWIGIYPGPFLDAINQIISLAHGEPS